MTDPLGNPYPDPAARPDLDNEVAMDSPDSPASPDSPDSPASPDSPDSPSSPASPPEAEPLGSDGMAGMDIEHEADADGYWRDEFGNRVDHEGNRVDEDGNRVDAGGDRIDPADEVIGVIPPVPPR